MSHAGFAAPISVAIKMRQKIRPLLFRLLFPIHTYWNRKPRQTQIDHLSLRIEPRVFDPGRHFSSKILARYIASLDLSGCRVLDMGTGSGIIGITAALQGAGVIAVDINPEAVRLASSNAQTHQVAAKMRALCGDLFSSLSPSLKFDWIIFNPPFFPRPAAPSLQAAYNAGDDYGIIADFLQQAKNFLAPAGKVLMIFSSDMDLNELQNLLARFHYRVAHCEIKPHLFEMFYLVQLAAR